MEGPPTHCRFDHPGFRVLGTVVFRLTKDDRVAALALSVDNNDVVLPLPSVAQLLGIRPDSPDGRMLNLVEQGLRFVPTLAPGDKLPSEVVTGEASWDPSPYHRQVASARLQLQLVSWIGGIAESDEAKITSQMLVVSVQDPAIRPRVEEALRKAAAELDVEGGGPAVAALIEELAHELSYIEALRERLLERVRTIFRGVVRASQDQAALSSARRETLFQVTRLATVALADVTSGFEEVDGQTAAIMTTLRSLERQRSFLRPHRDRLYCTQLAWDPVFRSWDTVSQNSRDQDGIWRAVDELYRFLARRYMSVQEWQSVMTPPDKTERGRATLVW